MFKKISYKKKFYALLLFLVMLGITGYKRSFKGTIETVDYYRESIQNISQQNSSTDELAFLRKEVNELDSIIGKKVKNPEIVQNRILGFLNDHGQNVTVSKIENTHITDDNYFIIYSNIISLKGDFNSLLKIIYEFEKHFQYARIAGMTFHIERNPRTSKTELYNDIIFQNYEKKQ